MTSKYILPVLGILFLIVALAAFTNTVYLGNPEGVLWICYTGLFIIAVGMFLKKDYLIVSQLNILTIPLIVWTIDFFSYFVLGETLFSITDYMFTSGNYLGKLISMQHIITIPLALYGLYQIGMKTKHAWIFSMLQVSLFFVISRVLTTPEKNINYVYQLGVSTLFPSEIYPLLWFAGYFITVLVTHITLGKFLRKKE